MNKNDEKEIKTTRRTARFAFVGIILTIINYFLYIIFNLIINNNNLLWLSSAISTTITAVLAFFFHSKITWKERTPKKVGIYNFFIWNAILALIISPFFTQLFSHLVPLYKFVYNISSVLNLPFTFEFIQNTGAFCLATAIIMVLNFLFYDKLVFSKQKDIIKTEGTKETTS